MATWHLIFHRHYCDDGKDEKGGDYGLDPCLITYFPKEDIVCGFADPLMSSQRIHVSFWEAALSHVKISTSVSPCDTQKQN